MTEDLAARLLDAQVEFAKRQLTDPDAFAALVEEEVTAFLDDSAQLSLTEAMPRELIKAVARKYTMSFPVEGAIPELVGQIAAALYAHPANDETTIEDVFTARRFDELVETIAELQITTLAVRSVLSSPTTADLCVEVLQRAVDSALPDRTGVRLRGLLGDAVERVGRRSARFVLRANAEHSDEFVVDVAREFWHDHAGERVSTFREVVDPADVEDVVVLVFELWRTLRESEYFGTLLDAGIDEFFSAYGDTTLTELLTELGLGRDDLLEEAMRFGPPVIERIDREGFLDAAIRRRIAPFYESAEFQAALDG